MYYLVLNMYKALIILILLLAFSAKGQVCDTIVGIPANYIDSNGLKQGLWNYTKKHILGSSYIGYGGTIGCTYSEQLVYYPLAKGCYKNNIKIGVWEYFIGDENTQLEKRINYHLDRSVTHQNIPYKYTLQINKDTTLIQGNLIHKLDTLQINCTQTNCSVSLSNNQHLYNFDYSSFGDTEFQLLRIQKDMYYREIKILKAQIEKD